MWIYALVVQWIERQPPELEMWVRLPPSANLRVMEISIAFYIVFCILFFICAIPNKPNWLRSVCMIGQIISLGCLMLFWNDLPKGLIGVEPRGQGNVEGRFFLCLIWLGGVVALLIFPHTVKK